MCTKNEEFHRRSKGGDLGKSKVLGLGGVLEAYYISTTLQEVEFFPILVYFYLWAVKGLFGLLWLVLWLVWLVL